jgi:hypothetical protein
MITVFAYTGQLRVGLVMNRPNLFRCRCCNMAWKLGKIMMALRFNKSLFATKLFAEKRNTWYYAYTLKFLGTNKHDILTR